MFDMDGTLSLPQNYMFREMREALNIPTTEDILDFVHALPEARQTEAHRVLGDIERRTMLKMTPQPGLHELFEWLRVHNLPVTIQTRNNREPVAHFLQTWLAGFKLVDPVLTREFHPYKPAPDGLFFVAREWGILPSELVMVGDSADDMQAAANAGAHSILLRNQYNSHLASSNKSDAVVDSLSEIINHLECRLVKNAN